MMVFKIMLKGAKKDVSNIVKRVSNAGLKYNVKVEAEVISTDEIEESNDEKNGERAVGEEK